MLFLDAPMRSQINPPEVPQPQPIDPPLHVPTDPPNLPGHEPEAPPHTPDLPPWINPPDRPIIIDTELEVGIIPY